MNLDQFFESLPFVGKFLIPMRQFWAENVAITNLTHVALGFGLAMIIFSKKKKVGFFLVIIAGLMHIIAYLK